MARKKRSGSKGFGQPRKPAGLSQEFDFDGLLNGDQVLITGPIIDVNKGVDDFYKLVTFKALARKLPSFQQAINDVLTPEIIYLARRRKYEYGEGLLTITPKQYRQIWREVYDTDGPLIFNWWTLSEIHLSKGRSELFGGTRILKTLAEYLISHSKERFPLILYAIPFSESDVVWDESIELDHAHLLLTVSLDPEQVVGEGKIYLIERATIPLNNFLPNAVNAVVDIRKLRDYCLNPEHDDGKHQARLFATTLGMTADDADVLRQILLEAVINHEAKPGRIDDFGRRYSIDFTVEWQDRRATLRSGWIIEHNSDIPRLTTCYPL